MSLADPLVIVNPASAGGNTGREWPGLAARIRENFGVFECTFTKAAGDARRLAMAAAQAGRKLILACGGDGTLSEVANGIIASQTRTELGLLPHGSGGDFRKTINLPKRIEDAARALARGRTREIDAGEINYINHRGLPEQRYFINIASFGMGGEVAQRANSSQKTFGGTAAFAYATIATTLTYHCPEIWLKIDDGNAQRRKISNVCIANGRYFGGGMKIAPDALIDDNLFDIVVVKALGITELVTNAHRLYQGTHTTLSYVNIKRGAIVAANPVDEKTIIRIEVDGEAPGRLPATFKIVPNALLLRCAGD